MKESENGYLHMSLLYIILDTFAFIEWLIDFNIVIFLTFHCPELETQHNTPQHNTTQHNTTQHNTTQHTTTDHVARFVTW